MKDDPNTNVIESGQNTVCKVAKSSNNRRQQKIPLTRIVHTECSRCFCPNSGNWMRKVSYHCDVQWCNGYGLTFFDYMRDNAIEMPQCTHLHLSQHKLITVAHWTKLTDHFSLEIPSSIISQSVSILFPLGTFCMSDYQHKYDAGKMWNYWCQIKHTHVRNYKALTQPQSSI